MAKVSSPCGGQRPTSCFEKVHELDPPGPFQTPSCVGIGWQPIPVFLPEESQGGGAWRAAVSGVAQSRTRLKRLNSSSSRPTGEGIKHTDI